MKRIVCSAWIVAVLLGAGCVVRSIQPWLSDDSRVKDPALAGSWHDVKSQSVAFFSESSSSDYDYDILWVQNGKDISRFTASLHRLDDTLLLVVGPEDPENMNGCVLLPGYLLLKTALEGDSLKLYGLDLDSFEERAAKAADRTPARRFRQRRIHLGRHHRRSRSLRARATGRSRIFRRRTPVFLPETPRRGE